MKTRMTFQHESGSIMRIVRETQEDIDFTLRLAKSCGYKLISMETI